MKCMECKNDLTEDEVKYLSSTCSDCESKADYYDEGKDERTVITEIIDFKKGQCFSNIGMGKAFHFVPEWSLKQLETLSSTGDRFEFLQDVTITITAEIK